MNQRRSSLQIMCNILKTLPAGKTEIMFSSNLSHFQLRNYLALLAEKGLIKVTEDRRKRKVFLRSPKGDEFISRAEDVFRLLEWDESSFGIR